MELLKNEMRVYKNKTKKTIEINESAFLENFRKVNTFMAMELNEWESFKCSEQRTRTAKCSTIHTFSKVKLK